MKCSKLLGSKTGVTLVELLVVMLIVVILAVSLTPLFRDYITKAQYTAEAVPVTAEMRTKITLSQYDRGYIPGVLRDTAGRPVTTAEHPAGSSLLGDAAALIPLQTFGEVTTAAGLVQYVPGAVESLAEDGYSASGVDSVSTNLGTAISDHFSRVLDVDYEHYTGNRLRPNHVFYRTDHAGYRDGAHMVVIGVFGDGNGLAVGTGYAVLELHNPTHQTKIVATWERYRAVGADVGQIAMLNSDDVALLIADGQVAANPDFKRENICFIGDLVNLVGDDEDDFAGELEALRAAGWVF